MIAHFGYLVRCEARNRLRRRLQRLRRPRYLFAAIVGLGYFWFLFGMPGVGGGELPDIGSGGIMPGLRTLGPLLLGVYVAATWLFGRKDGLAFRPAEVDMLFPAPITRRDLLRFKLLQRQLPLIFTAGFLTLAAHQAPLPWWLRLISFYLLFSTLQLHHAAAALVHASTERQGVAGWRRHWLALLLFAAAGALVLSSVATAMPALRAVSSAEALLRALQQVTDGAGARIALAPFRLVLAPVIAEQGAAWWRALPGALLVLAAHYLWVLRTDVAFEEAAAEAGERRARALQALTAGDVNGYSRALDTRGQRRSRPAAFRLQLEGRPEIALLWKNLTYARRDRARRTLIVTFLIGLTLLILLRSHGGSLGDALLRLGHVAFALCVTAVLVGPVWVRNDLRMDLQRIELLRTLPLPPRRLVLAEIAASALTLALVQLVLLTLAALLYALAPGAPLPPAGLALAFTGSALVLPALATLGVTIQCALALLFPAWVQLGPERPQGVEAMGQGILTLVGALLLLGLALTPALALAGLLAVALNVFSSLLATIAGVLLFTALVYGEVALVLPALGRLYERTDAAEFSFAR